MIAAAWLAALLAAAPARAADDNANGFESVVGPRGFATRPLCPRGTLPVVETGGALQPYRCARAASDAKAPSQSRALDAGSYGRFSITRQIAFDYPTAFRVQDAWKEDVPTLYLKIDDAAAGKPVTITITRYAESQGAYEAMSDAIGRDIEWQGAKDGGTQLIGRTRARVTYIPNDTRSVYLPISKESYYSFVYSAPADSYELYLPAFSRLLKSLKLAGAAQ